MKIPKEVGYYWCKCPDWPCKDWQVICVTAERDGTVAQSIGNAQIETELPENCEIWGPVSNPPASEVIGALWGVPFVEVSKLPPSDMHLRDDSLRIDQDERNLAYARKATDLGTFEDKVFFPGEAMIVFQESRNDDGSHEISARWEGKKDWLVYMHRDFLAPFFQWTKEGESVVKAINNFLPWPVEYIGEAPNSRLIFRRQDAFTN